MENEKDSFKSAVEKRLSAPTPTPAKPAEETPEEKQKKRNQLTKGYIDDVTKTFGISAQMGLDLFANDPEQKKGLKMYADVYGTPVVEVTNDGLFSINGQAYSSEDSKLLRDSMRNYYQSQKAETQKTPATPTPTPTPTKTAPVKNP